MMGVGLSDIMPPVRNPADPPGVKEFFKRYRGNGTRLRDYADMLDFCDLYAEPKMGRCKLISQGPRSLLSERTGLVDVERQQQEYDSWSPERRATIFNWQRRAFEVGSMGEPVPFEGTYGFGGLHLVGYILKSASRVLIDDLESGLLIYAEMLWQEERGPGDQKR